MAKTYYGGAFDIDPYEFWTREDLNELQSAIDDLSHGDFVITEIYLEDDKIFDISYMDHLDNDYHLEEDIKIDRRKCSTTAELCEKYAPIIVAAIEKELDRYRDGYFMEDNFDLEREA